MMERKVVPFSIKVLQHFNYPALDIWVRSRDQFLEYDKKEVRNIKNGEKWITKEYNDGIRNMDIAMNYFDYVILEIKSSIMFREFIYGFGDLARWAKSSRYDNPNILTISSEAKNLPLLKEAYDKYEEAILDYQKDPMNKMFDHVRELMPLAYQTTYFIALPAKQFIKYMAVFYKHLAKVYPDMWETMYLEMMNNDYLKPYLINLPKYIDCEESRKILRDDLNGAQYDGNMGEVLYSQIIRHEAVQAVGWVDYLKENPFKEWNLPNCKTKFRVVIKCDDKSWKNILQTRAFWFVVNTDEEDLNSWLFLLKHRAVFEKDGSIDLEKNKHLFQWFDKDGNYHHEIATRYKQDDRNRQSKGYNAYFCDPFDLEAPSIIDARIKRDGYNFLLDLYKQHFTKGYVKDNPENEQRKLWNKLNPDRQY